MPLQPPRCLEWIFPSIIWRGPTGDGSVYLTFDDGPDPNVTPAVLDILSDHKAKASFFLVGNRIAGAEKVVDWINQHNHCIGNHGYSHRKLGWSSSRTIKKEITDSESIFFSNGWAFHRLFRPPFGHVRPGMEPLLRKMGYRTVMWSIMPGDYIHTDPELLLHRTLSRLNPGSIIVLHDHSVAPKSMLTILPKLLKQIDSRGLTCKRLDEMKGVNIERGIR